MRSSWRTSIFGILLGLIAVAQQYGIKVGKVGNGDWLGLAGAAAAVGLGASARDNGVSSEDAGIK